MKASPPDAPTRPAAAPPVRPAALTFRNADEAARRLRPLARPVGRNDSAAVAGRVGGRRAASAWLTALQARALRPAPPVAASDGLGWGDDLAVERHVTAGPLVLVIPPEACHRLTLRLGPPGHDPTCGVAREWGGHARGGAMRAGEVTLVPAGGEHRWAFEGPTAGLHVLLAPTLVLRAAADAGLAAVGPDPLRPCLGRADAQAARLTRCLAAAMDGRAAPHLAHALAAALCLHLLARDGSVALPVRPGGLTAAQVRAVDAHLRGHLDQPLSLDNLSEVVDLSPTYFATRFRAAVGCPPHAYLVRLRVEAAVQLLRRRPERKAAAVAAEVGFSDHSHLTRQCKRLLGLTPSQIRRGEDAAALG